jgi:hypothetical protein
MAASASSGPSPPETIFAATAEVLRDQDTSIDPHFSSRCFEPVGDAPGDRGGRPQANIQTTENVVWNDSGYLAAVFLAPELRPQAGEKLVLECVFETTFNEFGGAYLGCVAMPPNTNDGDSDSESDAVAERKSEFFDNICSNQAYQYYRGTFSSAWDGKKHSDGGTGTGSPRIDTVSLVEYVLDFSDVSSAGLGRLTVSVSATKKNPVSGSERDRKLFVVSESVPLGAFPFIGVHSATVNVATSAIEGRNLVKSARKR